MKDVIVYPYSNYFTPFLRQMAYDKKYSILSAVIPGKWCFEGIDASFLDEGSIIGIPISTDFDEQLNYCSIVIWAEYDYTDNAVFFNHVLSQMKYAILVKKDIVCCQKLSPGVLSQFKELAKQNDVNFEYIFEDSSEIFHNGNNIITIPIITIMGIGENCSKFETQLILRRLFIESGYQFSQIGSRPGCELLGFHSFPDFMFNKQYTETEKISAFHEFIYNIQQKERKDFIILGIPGGIMPYDEKHVNYYGITCYEVFSSIKTDFNILNVWNQDLNKEFMQTLSNIMKYKFSATLDCVGISNINLIIRNRLNNDIEYCILDKRTIRASANDNLTVRTYNILEENDQISMLDQILKKLS